MLSPKGGGFLTKIVATIAPWAFGFKWKGRELNFSPALYLI